METKINSSRTKFPLDNGVRGIISKKRAKKISPFLLNTLFLSS